LAERNKLITEAFYLTKDIEKYSSGYRRISEYIVDYPTMYFDFEENSGGYLVKIGYTNQKTKDDPLNDPLNNRIEKIKSLIKENKYITRKEMAQKCNVSL